MEYWAEYFWSEEFDLLPKTFNQFCRIRGKELITCIHAIQKQISIYDNDKGKIFVDDLSGANLIGGGGEMLNGWCDKTIPIPDGIGVNGAYDNGSRVVLSFLSSKSKVLIFALF